MKTISASILAILALGGAGLQAGTVYLDDNLGQLWAGDPTTNTYAFVGQDATIHGLGGFTDIDFAGGVLYGLGPNGTLYTVSTADGQATPVGPTGLANPTSIVGLAGDSAGNLYASGINTLYQLNTGTGAGAVIGGGGNYVTSGDLDFDGSGNLFLTSVTDGTAASDPDHLFQLNPATGVGTDLGLLSDGTTAFSTVFGVAYDSDNGVFYGYETGGTQFDINTGNPSLSGTGEGVFTEVGGTQDLGGLLGAAFISTPEPSTFVMIGGALGLVGMLRRRRG